MCLTWIQIPIGLPGQLSCALILHLQAMRPRMQLIVQRNVNFNFASKLVRTPIAVMAQLVLSQAGVLCLVRVIDIMRRRDP